MHETPPHNPEHLARSAASVPVLLTGRSSSDRRGSWVGKAGRKSQARRPTPIRIFRGTWNLIVCALIAAMVLILWAVPVVLAISLGGFAIALVLSFLVSLFSGFVPRAFAILLAFLILLAVLLLAFYVLVPLLVSQVGALVTALPVLVQNLEQYVVRALEVLDTYPIGTMPLYAQLGFAHFRARLERNFVKPARQVQLDAG